MKNKKFTYKEKYLICKAKYNALLKNNENLAIRLNNEIIKHNDFVNDLNLKQDKNAHRDFVIFLVFLGITGVFGCIGIILSCLGLC